MSSETKNGRSFDYRPLGYDLRLIGPRAAAARLQHGFDWRPNLVPASYDTNVAPSMFAKPGDPPEQFQTEIDPGLVSDSYFTTFGLFRSAREAISFIPDRDDARHFQLWYFSLILPQTPPSGIFAGILKAMEGEVVISPDLQIERLGYEVLDQDGASVTHTYYNIGNTVQIDPQNLGEAADGLANDGNWLVAIDRLTHVWWLPE